MVLIVHDLSCDIVLFATNFLLQLSYCHPFNGSKRTPRSLTMLKRSVSSPISLVREEFKEMENSPMVIWREKMSVGFA